MWCLFIVRDLLFVAPAPLVYREYYLQGHQFEKVSKLIKIGTENLEMERAGFITMLEGFDTHNNGRN